MKFTPQCRYVIVEKIKSTSKVQASSDAFGIAIPKSTLDKSNKNEFALVKIIELSSNTNLTDVSVGDHAIIEGHMMRKVEAFVDGQLVKLTLAPENSFVVTMSSEEVHD